MLSKLTTGLQHLGIPAWNLDASVAFYEKLGFEVIHRKKTSHNETPLDAAFLKLHNFVIELYELEGDNLKDIKSRKDGHIDHFAINAVDVESLFEDFKSSDFKVIDEEIQYIDFFDKGVKFFRILGPSREVIEINQIISIK